MKLTKYTLILLSAIMIMASSCKKESAEDATTARMARELTNSPDSLKVKMLLESNMPMDSIAIYLGKVAIGEYPGVEIKNLSDADAYIYTHKSEKDYELYAIAMDEFSKSLPLVGKYKFYKKSSLVDPEKIGYQLGLEYVNEVMDKKLSIGKVDKEIADFRRACGEDEDTYNRFLKGFAVGISTRSPGEISAEVVTQYGLKR